MKKLSISLMVLVLCLSIAAVVYSKGAIIDLQAWLDVPQFYGVGEYCAKLEAQRPDIFYGDEVVPGGLYTDFVDCVKTVAPSYAVEACKDGYNPPECPSPKNLGECVSGWKQHFNAMK